MKITIDEDHFVALSRLYQKHDDKCFTDAGLRCLYKYLKESVDDSLEWKFSPEGLFKFQEFQRGEERIGTEEYDYPFPPIKVFEDTGRVICEKRYLK